MEGPSICNSNRDTSTGVTYHVMAYRKLTQPEVLDSIRGYLLRTIKWPRRGTTVTITTLIGQHAVAA